MVGGYSVQWEQVDFDGRADWKSWRHNFANQNLPNNINRYAVYRVW